METPGLNVIKAMLIVCGKGFWVECVLTVGSEHLARPNRRAFGMVIQVEVRGEGVCRERQAGWEMIGQGAVGKLGIGSNFQAIQSDNRSVQEQIYVSAEQ